MQGSGPGSIQNNDGSGFEGPETYESYGFGFPTVADIHDREFD
jgi:hypothetical protein